jgi:hypothetical protein
MSWRGSRGYSEELLGPPYLNTLCFVGGQPPAGLTAVLGLTAHKADILLYSKDPSGFPVKDSLSKSGDSFISPFGLEKACFFY